MVSLADRMRKRGIEVPALSIGSTPAMSAAESLAGIDEARPGNYVFYDGTQVGLGACQISDCAVTVVASVVSSPRAHTHSVVDAGALAMSKDPGLSVASPLEMGQIFDDYDSGALSSTRSLRGLSQEHGLVNDKLAIGTRVRILPNHSCLTVACFDEFAVARGGEVVDSWKIWRGR